jgi:hypothetical protein
MASLLSQRKHPTGQAPRFLLGKLQWGLLLVLATLSVSHVAAVEISARPQIRVGSRTTDNVLFSAEGAESAFGFDSGGGAIIKGESADWSSIINPTFNARRFLIGENLNADEYGVRTQHKYQASSRLLTEFKADYIRDSTLTTELTDAGRQNDVANRDTVNLQPSASYVLNELTSVNLGFLYSDVTFDAVGNAGLVDFTFKQGNAGITRTLNEQLQLFVTGFISQFDVEAIGSATRTYGAQTGITFVYSPDIAVDLAGGYVKSNIDFQEQFLAVVLDPLPRIAQVSRQREVSTSGPIASASIRKNFENTRTRLDYSRRVSPSSRGAQTLEDDIAVSVYRDMNRRLLLGFRGGYNMRGAETQEFGSVADLDRDQALLSGSVSYLFTQQLSLSSEYRFVRQTFTGRTTNVYSNALFITLSYNGDPHFFWGR